MCLCCGRERNASIVGQLWSGTCECVYVCVFVWACVLWLKAYGLAWPCVHTHTPYMSKHP